MMYKFVQRFDHCWMDRAPSAFSPLSFLTLAWAKRDLGLALPIASARHKFRGPACNKRNKVQKEEKRNLLAGVLVSQSVNLGRTGAHDIIRRRNILLGPRGGISKPSAGAESLTGGGGRRKKNVRLSSHLGLEYLAMVLHALNVLGGVLLVHDGVDVLVTEDG